MAFEARVGVGTIYQWTKTYKTKGYDGLKLLKKGRKPKEPDMSKEDKSKNLAKSEKEELILLRRRNEYLEAENAYLKKIESLDCTKAGGVISQGEKAAIIRRLRDEGYRLSYLLKVSKLPRSTYYFEENKVDIDSIKNQEIMDEIVSIFNEHKGRYGVRRIYHELLNRGFIINHKKVQRLMKKLNLKGKIPKQKYHSYKGNVGKIANNIINRDFTANKPDEKWTTDVSQFNLPFGKCYLSPILDMYTSEIISYDLSLHPNYEQITNMLDKAFKNHPNLEGLIFHSDQGWQYQMRHYHETLKDKGIIQSMSRKGNCLDNGIMESFFGTMKNEMFYGYEKNYQTFEEFSKAVEEYIYYYNHHRIQSKTKWMPPIIFRETSTRMSYN